MLLLVLLTVLACSSSAYGDSLNYFFTSNHTCPDIPWQCNIGGPTVCASSRLLDRTYCCGITYWTVPSKCQGANGSASSTQQQCISGASEWCCLESTYEKCTPNAGQINVCVSTTENLLGDVSLELYNKTFSSSLSASPQAATFSFDAEKLSAIATVFSTGLVSTSVTTPSSNSSDDLSSGAIAGTVIGAIAGVAGLFALVFLLLRRGRTSKLNKQTVHSLPEMDSSSSTESDVRTKISLQARPVEMAQEREAQELNAERSSELPG